MDKRFFLALPFALLGAFHVTPAVAQDYEQTAPRPVAMSSEPGSARPGWLLAVNLGSVTFDLDDSISDRFSELDIDLGDDARGGGLAVGYSWANQFALELQLQGGEVGTGNQEIDAVFFEAAIAAKVPLIQHGRVSPYLEGHLGVTGLGFEGDAIDDRVFVGGSTGFGGGVEVHVSRHWAFDMGYRYSLVHFENEVLETADGDREIDIDGSGDVHRFSMRAVFSF